MFKLTDADKDIIDRLNIVPRLKVSERDPFMNKPKKVWQSFHRPVARTSEILETLEPHETRRATIDPTLGRFADQE